MRTIRRRTTAKFPPSPARRSNTTTYHYVVKLECGAELESDRPEPVGSELACGHTNGHLVSTVVSNRPERD